MDWTKSAGVGRRSRLQVPRIRAVQMGAQVGRPEKDEPVLSPCEGFKVSVMKNIERVNSQREFKLIYGEKEPPTPKCPT